MPFVQAKCPNCGGMLAVDDSKKAAICQFCEDAFIVEEAVNNYNTYNITNNTTNQNFGEGAVVNIIENSSTISVLMERVFMFLEEGNFFSADEYCEKALDLDPKCAEAYLGKLMVDLRCKSKKDLQYCDELFDKNINYKKIIRFGDTAVLNELKGYLNTIKDRIKNREQRKEELKKAEEQEVLEVKKNQEIVEASLKLVDEYELKIEKSIDSIKAELTETINQRIAQLQVEVESHKAVLKGVGIFKTSERKIEKDAIARLESEIASLKTSGCNVQLEELRKKGNESVMKYRAEVEDFLERKYNLLFKKKDDEKIDIEVIHKKEGGNIRNLKVLKVLYDCGRAMTISEVVEELEKNEDGETYCNMGVCASLKRLAESGYVSMTDVRRKAYFEIVNKGIYRLRGIKAPKDKPYVVNKAYSNQQCPEMPNVEDVLKIN